MLHSLVSGKAGRISRNLKQNTAGFAEVNRMKILAVDDGCDVIFEFRQLAPPMYLLLIGCRSPGDVMDGSHGNTSGAPMNIYGDAVTEDMVKAHGKIVRLAMPPS